MNNLPQKRDSFYAAHVPKTLSECIVRAAEHGQSVEAEFEMLRGMLCEIWASIKAQKRAASKEERDEIREFARDIRATAKAVSEMSAKEKGMLHPSALGIFGNMIVQIVVETLPDEKQRTDVRKTIQNRIAQIPVKDM